MAFKTGHGTLSQPVRFRVAAAAPQADASRTAAAPTSDHASNGFSCPEGCEALMAMRENGVKNSSSLKM